MLPFDPMEVVAHAIADVVVRVVLFGVACWCGYVLAVLCLIAQSDGVAALPEDFGIEGPIRWLAGVPIQWAAGLLLGFLNPVLWVYALIYPVLFYRMVWGEESRAVVFVWVAALEAVHTYVRVGEWGWAGWLLMALAVAAPAVALLVDGWLVQRETKRLDAMSAELAERVARGEAERGGRASGPSPVVNRSGAAVGSRGSQSTHGQSRSGLTR